MKKILTIILCSALVMISGCDKYDFDQEQFRKEVNLLSNSNLVYDRQVAELQQGGDTLFVVASLSGSQATDEPVTVVLQHSDTLLRLTTNPILISIKPVLQSTCRKNAMNFRRWK